MWHIDFKKLYSIPIPVLFGACCIRKISVIKYKTRLMKSIFQLLEIKNRECGINMEMSTYKNNECHSSRIYPYIHEMERYLLADDIIDFKNESIVKLSDTLSKKSNDEIDYIKLAYEFVRDKVFHSADVNNDVITCTASEVLNAGHGICFAKSNLLAALLRCKSIPTGFCYQKLILDDDTAPVLIYHGLNGVYIKKYEKWIRLDARGNKIGVDAQFSLEKEQLAFPIRPELGEKDIFVVYPEPDKKVLEKLIVNKTRTELWTNLPTELDYDKQINR